MKNRGITLVALVITIIIMLILAGVTLRITLGDNGLIKKSKQTVDIYEQEVENEALALSMTSYNLAANTEKDNYKLGKSLSDRNLKNGSTWDIIVEKSDNTTYGTGWNYVEKGTEIEGYGKAKNNWLINYETGEIKELESNTYDNFNYKSTIAIENPIYNLDSANVSLDKSSWGDNATLYYFDDTQYDTHEKRLAAYNLEEGKNVAEFSGYDRQKSTNINEYIDENTGAFKFNGNNYIEIYNENGFDFSNGLTFEFYGKITDFLTATRNEKLISGLFSFWEGNYDLQCDARLLYYYYDNQYISYRLFEPVRCDNFKSREYGEWPQVDNPWNQTKIIGDILNKDVYFAISFDNNENERITQSIYVFIDGEKSESSGWFSKAVYEDFVTFAKQYFKYIELGRSTEGYTHNWCYLKGLCYALRVYNKSLSSTEVQANYDVTTSFHKYIIENKK